MAQQCQLWMGSLQPYMNESFILGAFRIMGEDASAVKMMRSKFSSEPAGYCFVSFECDDAAINAMHKLNGKPIPGTNPIVRFKLNSATPSQNKSFLHDKEFSVWVGDLSSDVDDYNLYRVFSSRYGSIKTAKIITDDGGFSRGYGFIKFGHEEEQRAALYEMNGYVGLGSKPLKICSAVPKPNGNMFQQPQHSATSVVQQAYDQYNLYSQQYYQYYQNYYQQSGYGNNYSQQQAYHQMDPSIYYAQQENSYIAIPQNRPQQYGSDFYKYEHRENYELTGFDDAEDGDKMREEKGGQDSVNNT